MVTSQQIIPTKEVVFIKWVYQDFNIIYKYSLNYINAKLVAGMTQVINIIAESANNECKGNICFPNYKQNLWGNAQL